MTDAWRNRVLHLAHRTTEDEDLEFVNLVDLAVGECDLETCRILMRTFVTDQDFGVQESVVSALGSAATKDYQLALLEELPRLNAEAPAWADVLVEREIVHNASSLRESITAISPNERDYFAKMVAVKYPDFRLQ